MAIINGTPGDDLTAATNGTNAADTINLFSGNDQTRPGDGADDIFGGTGTDRVSYIDSDASVIANLLTGLGSGPGYSSGDTYDSIEDLFGSGFNDTLTGNNAGNSLNGFRGNDLLSGGGGDDVMIGGEGVDTLWGGAGNDILLGEEGADSFNGGSGIDVITYFNSVSAVNVNLGANTATGGDAAGDTFRNVEGIEGTGGNDRLTGDSASNQLFGGAGRDVLDGAAGADTMQGGLGNDFYFVDNANDVVSGEVAFSEGGGIDTVRAFVNYVQPTNIELVRLGNITDTTNLNAVGNDAPGTLVGNAGNNNLIGRGGNDQLNGNGGNDTITGNTGRDTLVGGSGSDTFIYTSVADSRAGGDNRDVVNGFSHGFDRIDLSNIDANTANGISTNEAFVFVGTSGFSGTAGELRTQGLGGANAVIVEGDINGDSVADIQIFVNLTTFMTGSDFIL